MGDYIKPDHGTLVSGIGEAAKVSFSPSERRTLQHIAEGELAASELDWVALQRLKRLGLVEERSTGPALTQDGRRELQRLLARA